MEIDTVRIPGLTRLEGLELKKRFPQASITFDSTSGSDEAPGELATIALITLTAMGIQALAAYFLMDQKKGRIERTVEVVGKKGTRRKEKIVIDLDERTSHADVVKQLGRMLHVDIGAMK